MTTATIGCAAFTGYFALIYALAQGNNLVAWLQYDPPVVKPDELRLWEVCLAVALVALIVSVIMSP